MGTKLTAIEVNLRLLIKRIEELRIYETCDEAAEELKRVEEKIYELGDLVEIIEAKLEL
jgi:hypothetical protein